MAKTRHNIGVTLIEMLVVVSILALLTTLVITITLAVENQSKERAVANIFSVLRSALQEYHEETGRFPVQSEKSYDPTVVAAHSELLYNALDSAPASRQILKQVNSAFVATRISEIPGIGNVPRIGDPWGTPLDYVYLADAQFPELISAGRDKTFGTDDDISSKGM